MTDILEKKQSHLAELRTDIAPFVRLKRQIDNKAARHATRVIWVGVGITQYMHQVEYTATMMLMKVYLYIYSTAYLFLQSAMVAKLTFFSRFGWDVMEPVTYFITFYTGLGGTGSLVYIHTHTYIYTHLLVLPSLPVGLLFFQLNKIEFSYPALYSALLQRKKTRLYARENFEINKFNRVSARTIQRCFDSIVR
jgi:hypothetical protein